MFCRRSRFLRYHCCSGYEKVNDGSSGCRGGKVVFWHREGKVVFWHREDKIAFFVSKTCRFWLSWGKVIFWQRGSKVTILWIIVCKAVFCMTGASKNTTMVLHLIGCIICYPTSADVTMYCMCLYSVTSCVRWWTGSGMSVTWQCVPMYVHVVLPVLSLMDTFEHVGVRQLEALVSEAGLDTVLEQQGPYTVFAPLRTALAAMSADTRFMS